MSARGPSEAERAQRVAQLAAELAQLHADREASPTWAVTLDPLIDTRAQQLAALTRTEGHDG